MSNFNTLQPVNGGESGDVYLLRQNGVDVKQSRDALASSVGNATWGNLYSYEKGSEVIGSDGNRYTCLVSNGVDFGGAEDPTTSSKWRLTSNDLGDYAVGITLKDNKQYLVTGRGTSNVQYWGISREKEGLLPYQTTQSSPEKDGNLKEVGTLNKSTILEGLGYVNKGYWDENPTLGTRLDFVVDRSTGDVFGANALPYQVDSAAHPDPNALVGTELRDVSQFLTSTDVSELAVIKFSNVANLLLGNPIRSVPGDQCRTGGTVYLHESGNGTDITHFKALTDVQIEDHGVVFDFVFDEVANTFSGTDNMTALTRAQESAKSSGVRLVAKAANFGISGLFTSDVPFDLKEGWLCQLDQKSDTVSVQKTGGLFNGTVYGNQSTGKAWYLSGAEQLFPGRQKVDLGSNLRVVNCTTVKAVGDYVGQGVLLEANGGAEYISAIHLDLVIQGFADGYDELTTGDGFINSNDIKLTMNSCMRYITKNSSIKVKVPTIGQSTHLVTIQPQSGSEYAIRTNGSEDTFTGQVWDAALFSDVTKCIQLINVAPPSPNQGFITCKGNVFKMFGVNVDRCYGQIETNTIDNPHGNNPSQILNPLSNFVYDSRIYSRKVKTGINGDGDTFSYLSAVDNFLANADKRFLTLATRTNRGGSNLGSINPTSGTYRNVFVANEAPVRYETNDYLTFTISFKEGDFPVNSIPCDFIGTKLLSTASSVIFDIRYAGESTWTEVVDYVGVNNRILSTRIRQSTDPVTVARTAAIDGVRIRIQSNDGVIEVENLFLFSPDLLGMESVNANDAFIATGDLRVCGENGQGILLRNASGNIVKLTLNSAGTGLDFNPL